jgi:hypothetical protein
LRHIRFEMLDNRYDMDEGGRVNAAAELADPA